MIVNAIIRRLAQLVNSPMAMQSPPMVSAPAAIGASTGAIESEMPCLTSDAAN